MNETLDIYSFPEEQVFQILNSIDPDWRSKDTDGLLGWIQRYLENKNTTLFITYLTIIFHWDSKQIKDFLQALDKLSL